MGEKDLSDRALAGDDALSFVPREVFRARARRRRRSDRARRAAGRPLPHQHALHDHAGRIRPHRIELQLDRHHHVAVDRGAARSERRQRRRRHLLLVERPRRAGAVLAADRDGEARLRPDAQAAAVRRPAGPPRCQHAVHRHQHRLARHGHLEGLRHGARATATPAAAGASS